MNADNNGSDIAIASSESEFKFHSPANPRYSAANFRCAFFDSAARLCVSFATEFPGFSVSYFRARLYASRHRRGSRPAPVQL